MLRISRLTDYGTLILVYMASHDGQLRSASDIAAGTHVALPTVQKLLKLLAASGLVRSVRGADGGYCLARSPLAVSAADILDALEGPIAITECSIEQGSCELEASCSVGGAWQKISKAMRMALEDVSLVDLGHPPTEFPLIDLTGTLPTSPGSTHARRESLR